MNNWIYNGCNKLFCFIPANITADIPIRFIENPTMASHKKFCNDIREKSNSKNNNYKSK